MAVRTANRAKLYYVVNAWAFAASLIAALLVFAVRYWLDVLRIAASPVIAQMIRFEPFRHGPVEMLPDKPIRCDPHALSVPASIKNELPIAILTLAALPLPARLDCWAIGLVALRCYQRLHSVKTQPPHCYFW